MNRTVVVCHNYEYDSISHLCLKKGLIICYRLDSFKELDVCNLLDVDIIVFSDSMCPNRVKNCNIPIINYKLIESELFSYEKLYRISHTPITILSNFCIGGHLYKTFGLKMNSPTINMYCFGESFFNFVMHLYNEDDMDMKEYIDARNYMDSIGHEKWVTKGVLCEDSIWYFNHHATARDAIESWNKRFPRINRDCIIIVMVLNDEKDLQLFERIPYSQKIGLYYKKNDNNNILFLNEWSDPYIRLKYNFNYPRFANQTAIIGSDYFKEIWLDFLYQGVITCGKNSDIGNNTMS